MTKIANKDHIPVLLQEVLKFLAPQKDQIYVDATFGAGGYSTAILAQANCRVISIDCDQGASKYYNELPKSFQERCQLINDNFSNLAKILLDLKISSIAGIVFDLGLSSMQIADNTRGFSFNSQEDLDMRMDQSKDLTAADIVNGFSEKEIADIIFHYGDERRSRAVAKCIVNYRQKGKINTVPQLIEAIKPGLRNYKDRIHFATRTFQALRIYVNNELENLAKTLQQIPQILAENGKAIFVTFHSLEDRLVKEYFRDICSGDQRSQSFVTMTKKIVIPCQEEIKNNPRARSAKLRAIRRDK
jgi:16S rRNA (cytosine1402-N4)-methyltransferase